jgi:outer membrane biosynthesis protein TonB
MSGQPRTSNGEDRATAPGRRSASRNRMLGGAVSLLTHAGIVLLLAFAWASAELPKAPDPAPMPVELIHEPAPPAPPKPAPKPAAPRAKPKPKPTPAKTKPTHPKPVPPRQLARRTPPHPHEMEALPAGDTQSDGSEVSEAELAGASSADAGPAGGTCDMARWLQNALRKDQLVQSAIAQVRRIKGAGAIRVWNGDWVQSHGEDGKGLAAVREAIIWEVAFAPKACRAEPVRGMVLLSMNDSARLALGSGAWRWSDLLR